MSKIARKELTNFMFQALKVENGRCLEPEELCDNTVINAHSIQDSRVLEQIAEDGHVIMLKQNIDAKKGCSVDFKSIGIHKATTFTGLCSKHDNNILNQ